MRAANGRLAVGISCRIVGSYLSTDNVIGGMQLEMATNSKKPEAPKALISQNKDDSADQPAEKKAKQALIEIKRRSEMNDTLRKLGILVEHSKNPHRKVRFG